MARASPKIKLSMRSVQTRKRQCCTQMQCCDAIDSSRDRLGLQVAAWEEGLLPSRGTLSTAIDVSPERQTSSLFDSSRGTDQSIVSPSPRRKVRNPAEVCQQPRSKFAWSESSAFNSPRDRSDAPCRRRSRGRSAAQKRPARGLRSQLTHEEIQTSRSEPVWKKTRLI